ncbi:putative atp-dependent dna helicase chr12 [Quercus suber]|uniref:Atp-dependent dna helicase chr12 n=1 Tax=Quercus suber TaxID=58331 RepID=A0AAW0MCF2_QUESU
MKFRILVEDHGSPKGDLLADFEDALLEQRPNCMSGFGLTALRENRYQSHIQHRLTELEVLPSNRGEELQTKCLLELYGLKLAELQSKVRSEVSSEYWLRVNCAEPDKQLFDWGMMRLRRPLYGVGDAFAMDADDQFRKKRDAERLSRLEEEEKNYIETRKRKFFAEVLNAVREFQLQIQNSMKRRRQRNDGIMQWHQRLRQRATRAEKLRFQALKSDDQEAYMRMVKESKNERLTMLLEETNKLLVNLGAAVKRQKDAKHSDDIEALKDSEADLPELDASNDGTPQDLLPEEEMDIIDSNGNSETSDLLEGQRQYHSAIHSIQEKVTEQPAMLQGGELRPYQVEGLQWMVSLFNNNLNGILADEMGLGKTIQTISLIAYLMESKGVTGPHLIVAPKARKAMREKLSGEGKFNVLITHYDLIMRDKAFLKKIHWYYMIVDEGHRLKNHESVLAKTLVSGYQIQRRLLLTGTPIQNSLQELWALLNFLLPHIFNSVQNFEEWFNAPFKGKGDVSLTDEEELLIIRRLHQVIRPFILRRKKDEVEKYLPGKSQVILKCDTSAWQKAYYQQITDVGREDHGSPKGDLLADFEDALLEQRPNCMSGFGLTALRENRYQSHIQHRLTELEVLPSNRGEELQTKCLLELYGLKRLSRLEEEEKNYIETRKRKFFAEVLNAVREFQLQIQNSMKRRRQRNDGIMQWHQRLRQRATRAEKLRFQALKSDDQEAYMRMVKESKNERLTMLLEETNKLLVNLGAAVKRQKDAKHSDDIEALKDSEADLPELDASNDGTPQDLLPEEEMDIIDSNGNSETSDLLEGQRQYHSAIHSIQEKVLGNQRVYRT